MKKNKNDCNCDSCNITTVNAPVKRGKRKQPCNNLFINSVYVNDYRSAPTRMDVKGSSEREYKKKRKMTSTKKEGEKITAHFKKIESSEISTLTPEAAPKKIDRSWFKKTKNESMCAKGDSLRTRGTSISDPRAERDNVLDSGEGGFINKDVKRDEEDDHIASKTVDEDILDSEAPFVKTKKDVHGTSRAESDMGSGKCESTYSVVGETRNVNLKQLTHMNVVGMLKKKCEGDRQDEMSTPLKEIEHSSVPGCFKTSTPIYNQSRIVPLNVSVSTDENDASTSNSSPDKVGEGTMKSSSIWEVDRFFMRKFRNLTIYNKPVRTRSTDISVKWWKVCSWVFDEVWNVKVNTIDGLFTYLKNEVGMTLHYDKKMVVNNEGLDGIHRVWEWLLTRDMRRGVKRKTYMCMSRVVGAPTKFPKLMGWRLFMCRMVSSLNVQVFEDENNIVHEDYIKDWGRYDWLDQAEGEIMSQLDAGEIMDLLMNSESFGSTKNNDSGNGSNGRRMLLSIERMERDSSEGDVSQDVTREIVSRSCSL